MNTAQQLMDWLFTNGNGRKADRIVLRTDHPWPSEDITDIGTHSRSAVLAKVEELLASQSNEPQWTQNIPTEQAWYWHCHDRSDVPFPLSVLKSGGGKQQCFVAHDQAGLERSINCAEYGGWWKPITLPAPPEVS